MKLRTRVLLFAGLLVLAPLVLLAAGIRREMANRLTAQYTRRVEDLSAIVAEDFASRGRGLGSRLHALSEGVRTDDTFRAAVSGKDESLRPYLLDFAGWAMSLTGLDLLQIQDAAGRILSSGHYRNEFDRLDPRTPRLLTQAGAEPALLLARRPEGSFLAIARVDSVRLGGQSYYLVGGFALDRKSLADLARDPDIGITLHYPGGIMTANRPEAREPAVAGALHDEPTSTRLLREVLLPALPAGEAPADSLTEARIVLTHSLAGRRELLRSLDLWLAGVWLLAALGTVVLAIFLASRVTRPVEDLARRAATLDLERLDTRFPVQRSDEVGTLARVLAAMTARLQGSVARLKRAERQATLGEIARQVNHDLRNAFTPLRNVIRHLSQVAQESPDELAPVYRERQGTLETGLAYLEDLATNYARLTPKAGREPCDLNEIVLAVSSGRREEDGGPVRVTLARDVGKILADPVGLRRIVENLVSNASESLTDPAAVVRVRTSAITDEEQNPLVELAIADEGRGIPAAELDRIFDHFYTTKDGGSGLGLSIVKRLVTDFGGSIAVASEPGRGTSFTLRFPVAELGGKGKV